MFITGYNCLGGYPLKTQINYSNFQLSKLIGILLFLLGISPISQLRIPEAEEKSQMSTATLYSIDGIRAV